MAPRFTEGDRVVYTPDLNHGPSTIQAGVVLAPLKGEWVRVRLDGVVLAEKGTDLYHVAYVWPERVKPQLIAILTRRQELKKAFDDSMSMIYELSNQLARGEL